MHLLIYSFHFPTSFSLHAFFCITNEKKNLLSLYLFPVSAESRSLHPLIFFSWVHLLLIFRFSLAVPLLTFYHNSLPSSQCCCIPVAASQISPPCCADCYAAITSQWRYRAVSDQSHAGLISDVPHFLYGYLWGAVAEAQSYIKKNA